MGGRNRTVASAIATLPRPQLSATPPRAPLVGVPPLGVPSLEVPSLLLTGLWRHRSGLHRPWSQRDPLASLRSLSLMASPSTHRAQLPPLEVPPLEVSSLLLKILVPHVWSLGPVVGVTPSRPHNPSPTAPPPPRAPPPPLSPPPPSTHVSLTSGRFCPPP